MRFSLAVLSMVAVLISSSLNGQDQLKPEDPLAIQIPELKQPSSPNDDKTDKSQPGAKDEQPKRDEQQKDEDKIAAEATEKIQAFFEEMEEVMAGPDKFGRIVTGLKSDLKAEYQNNEKRLLRAHLQPTTDLSEALDTEQINTLNDRQKVIVQCYIELTNRASSDDPRVQMDLHQKLRDHFRQFRLENPTLAADARIRNKEQELAHQAMQGRMRRGVATEQTLTQTRRTLSANSDIAMAGKVLDPIDPLFSLAHPGEQQGPIQEQRGGLQAILKLKWKGENLSIDREHWDVMFAGMTIADVQTKVNMMLQENGAPLEENRRGPRGMSMAVDASNVERLFQELRGTGSGGYSRSGSGQTVQTSFRKSNLEARMKLSPTRFELTVEELNGPGRLMRVVESEKGLELLLVGDLVHRLSSTDDGLSVVELSQDDVLKFSAKSFADLYRLEPRFVETRFFALLDHLGIIPPASRFHPQIVARLLEIISLDEARLQAEVDELVVELDADRFTTREAAYAKLLTQMDKYYDLLYVKQADETISTEVMARIKKLLSTSIVKEASQLDSVVSVLRLADDAEYLDELQGIVEADQRASIERRLELLKQ